MQHHEHERISPGDNAPTPSQLRKLALIGGLSAVRRARLRRLRENNDDRQRRITIGGTNPPVFYTAKTQTDLSNFVGQAVPRQMSGRFSARIDEAGEKTWNLKFVDIQHETSDSGHGAGERTVYNFEWTRASVKLARRTLEAFGDGRSRGRVEGNDEMDRLMNEIDQFHLEDDIAQQWSLELDMAEVTKADCQNLIDEAGSFFDQIDDEFVVKGALRSKDEELDNNRSDGFVRESATAGEDNSWPSDDLDDVE